MKPQPTIQDERKLMDKLMRDRERQTPERVTPDWIASYWRRLAT
ncbi:MAG TPA: hypothetical protein VFF75_04365 [Methylophilaceae bacterium]|nr:hypothetical protein [Methylophilaceae bacterium]